MHFAIVNETKQPAVDKTGVKLDHELLVLIAKALAVHMARDFAAHWENLPQVFTVCDALTVPPKAVVFHLVDFIPEAPDALAYHTLDDQGRPVLRLGVQTILQSGGTLISGPDSVSCAMGHEADETWCNGPCEIKVTYSQSKNLYYECCDPVQGSSYDIEIDGTPISVPNFVTQRYFDAMDAQGPWDFLGELKGPLTVASGGYLPFDDGTQIFGDKVSAAKQEHVLKYGRIAWGTIKTPSRGARAARAPKEAP